MFEKVLLLKLDYLRNIEEDLRSLCHVKDCDDIFDFPETHEECSGCMNCLTHVLWRLSDEIRHLYSVVRRIKNLINALGLDKVTNTEFDFILLRDKITNILCLFDVVESIDPELLDKKFGDFILLLKEIKNDCKFYLLV